MRLGQTSMPASTSFTLWPPPAPNPHQTPPTVMRLGQTSMPTSTSFTMKFTNAVIGAVVTLPPERDPKLSR